jgi:CheY-like chemotaxis protein
VQVLIVEDESAARQNAIDLVRRVVPEAEIEVRESRDSAIAAINELQFDLVLCDLNIAETDGSLDTDENHGFAVFSHAREIVPGMPIIFLTGFATPKNTADRLASGGLYEIRG